MKPGFPPENGVYGSSSSSSSVHSILFLFYLHFTIPVSLLKLIKSNLRPRLRRIAQILDKSPIRIVRFLLHCGPKLEQVLWNLLPRGAEHID